jgi:hypothetical protein
MPDYKEVTHERLYLKEQGTERVRKSAAGRLKHMLAQGWRETDRWHTDRYIMVRLERSGVSPWIGQPIKISAADLPPRREGRRGPPFGGGGGRGGGPPRGGGRGGPPGAGAPGGGPPGAGAGAPRGGR